MRIHCDACRAPIDQDDAVVRADDEGELFWFCTTECADTAETLDPDRELDPTVPPRRG